MNIEEIIHMEHSDNISLIPLKSLDNKEFEEIINSFGLNIDNFYKVKGKLYPYCYLNNTVLVEIYEMSKDFFVNFMVLEAIEQRERIHKECIESNNYNKLFTLIDKPFRFEMYEKLYSQIPNEQKYDLFNFIYTSSEYGFNGISREFLEEIYKYNKNERKIFSDDIITVYRGECSKSTPYTKAYSWTTNLKVAKKFATRFGKDNRLYMGKVNQKDVLDYFDNRNEDELIVFPEYVFNVEEIEIVN